MAGHSHASNVKHKKDRNDKVKSELFLKLRKKIEQIISQEGNYEKAFSLARENNFPKDKVNAIIEKTKIGRESENSFFQKIYKSNFDIVWCLEGFFGSGFDGKFEKISSEFNLEKVVNENVFDHFQLQYSLILKSDKNIEDFLFSSISAPIFDKINKIEEIDDSCLKFKIIFSEKQARNQAFDQLSLVSGLNDCYTENLLDPFFKITLDSEQKVSYFLRLKNKLLELEKDLKVFSNVVL